MKNIIFFLHSAGNQDGPRDGSNPFIKALKQRLPGCQIVHPLMPTPEDPSYEKWAKRLATELKKIQKPFVFVGHSLGGSVLLKFLSEESYRLDVKGIFLVAAPFWGAPDWESESFQLKKDFQKSLPKNSPIHFYHGSKDDIVPASHLKLYAQSLPGSQAHLVKEEGHLFENGLPKLESAIKNLGSC